MQSGHQIAQRKCSQLTVSAQILQQAYFAELIVAQQTITRVCGERSTQGRIALCKYLSVCLPEIVQKVLDIAGSCQIIQRLGNVEVFQDDGNKEVVEDETRKYEPRQNEEGSSKL